MKRNGRFTARVRRLGFPAKTKTFTSLKDAQRWAAETERLAELGGFSGQDCTLRELLERYANEVTPTKRSRDVEIYVIHKLARSWLGEIKLSELSSKEIARYRDDRLQSVGPSACNRDLSLISDAIRIAISEWGFSTPENPVANLRRPPQPHGRTRRLEGDEQVRLLASCEASSNPYLKPLVVLAIETAMRRGELLGLQWQHVFLEQKYVHLPLTKNGTSRDVPLSPLALRTLERMAHRRSFAVIPIDKEALKGLWSRAIERAGISDLHFHDLRHEATSLLFEKGLNVIEVASITGHRDLRSLQRYVQLRPTDLANKI